MNTSQEIQEGVPQRHARKEDQMSPGTQDDRAHFCSR